MGMSVIDRPVFRIYEVFFIKLTINFFLNVNWAFEAFKGLFKSQFYSPALDILRELSH